MDMVRRNKYAPLVGAMASGAARQFGGYAYGRARQYVLDKFKGRGRGRTQGAMRRQPIKNRFQPRTRGLYSRKATTTRGSNGTSTNGVSSGFYKAKVSRKAKKYKRQRAIGNKGGFYEIEDGGLVTGKTVVYLGHATNPMAQMRRQMVMAMVKALYNKAGYDFSSWNDEVPNNDNVLGTMSIDVLYKADNSTTTPISRVTPVIPFNATYRGVVDALIALFDVGGSDFNKTQFEWHSWELYFQSYDPAGTSLNAPLMKAKILLQLSKVRLYSKSNLKVQNMSTGGGGDQSNEVDRVPLYGTVYSGKGTGTVFNGQRQVADPPFICDKGGLIKTAPTIGGVDDTKEPPLISSFRGIKRGGKLLLDPGQLKTSTLTNDYTGNLNKLWQTSVDDSQSALTWLFKKIGFFSFFGLEKMIETDPVEATRRDIVCAYELDARYGAVFYEKRSKFTAMDKI